MSTPKRGNSAKDSQYLARIKEAIEGMKDHPRNNGVKMQAHHVISAEGMRLSGLGKKIEKFGYDINLLANLVFIPCTLQGACYLGIQPHRGNHTALVNQDDYDDDDHQEDYHDMVARRIKELDLPLKKECKGSETFAEVQTKLDGLSKSILKLIQKKPKDAPLTSIATHFGPTGKGCAGVDSVEAHKRAGNCPVHRKHLFDPANPEASQRPPQKCEEIKSKLTGRYELQVGQ